MIIGKTDKIQPRRSGKIRSGYQEEGAGGKKGKLVNTPHFLLHDAPGLLELFGETTKEIYFTVYADGTPHKYANAIQFPFIKDDLRWYVKNNLNCMSMHYTDDIDGRLIKNSKGEPMPDVAACFVPGDIAGVMQRPFPKIRHARIRKCLGDACPQSITKECKPHTFFDIIVPQYSMGDIFTIDTTSIHAMLNINSVFALAYGRYMGKISGQIFKLYKDSVPTKYYGSNGSPVKGEADAIHVCMVPFEEYEKKFRNEIKEDDWKALMGLRNRPAVAAFEALSVMEDEALPAPESSGAAQLESTSMQAIDESEVPEWQKKHTPEQRVAYSTIAEDPVATKYFEEVSTLTGLENNLENRYKTAAASTSLPQLIDRLKARIAKEKQIKAGTPKDLSPQKPSPAQVNPSIESPLY